MLCSAVNNYISTAKGLPFFYVVGDIDYGTTLDELKQNGLDVVRISDFCSSKDQNPSIDNLIDHFRTSDVDFKSNKCVLVGLGEYLALRGEQETLRVLRRLKDTTLGNARVVILLRAIAPQVVDLIADDIRLKNQNRVHISSDVNTTISVVNVRQDIGVVKEQGIKHLLSIFEDGLTGVQYVNTALYLSNALIPISEIVDAYDAIKFIVKNFTVSKQCGTDEYWARFIVDLNKNGKSIDTLFEKYGFADHFESEFYDKVSGFEYKNWLFYVALKHYINEIENQYLKYVVESTVAFSDFKHSILTAIIDISHSDKKFTAYYVDRKKLVREFPESDIAIFVHENSVEIEEGIYKLTDNTKLEREEIIRIVSQIGIHPALSQIYPDLDLYLQKYVFDCGSISNELTDYFEQYKRNKLSNVIDESFMDLVLKYAKLMRYTMLDTRDNALASISNKESVHLMWIDALGVEYLSYISELARKKGLSIHVDVVRADLPTITSVNKGFYDAWPYSDKEKVSTLDDVKHKEAGGYKFTECQAPIHLAEELAIIERAINEAATELAMHNCKKFVIASDHGASRLAVIHRQEEKYETDTKGEHSGRCCKKFDDYDLPYAIPEGDYLVLADYGRFKGSRAANVEVHGGASLEEVVIPIISLTLKRQTEIIIKVLHKDEIVADFKKGTTISIYISDVENYNNVSVVVNGTRYQAVSDDKSHYTIEMKDVRRAKKYTADVYDGDDLIGKVGFTVKGKTASVNDDFDDLF